MFYHTAMISATVINIYMRLWANRSGVVLIGESGLLLVQARQIGISNRIISESLPTSNPAVTECSLSAVLL